MGTINEYIKHNKFTRKMWIYLKIKKLKSCDGEVIKRVSKNEIIKLKNSKKGKRCFIIGNGPSLTTADLDKLKNEDSFGVNRIYKIFDKTEWRPTFYVSQDNRVLEEIESELSPVLKTAEGVFLNASVNVDEKYLSLNNVYQFYVINVPYNIELPEFSHNPADGVFEGYTVAYACIQFALYMGYSEIYIIGTDHNYSINKLNDGTIKQDDNIQNYMPELAGKICYPPQMEKSTLAFRKARQVCDSLGICIKNATRGGKLEEFERVDFDGLFEEKS